MRRLLTSAAMLLCSLLTFAQFSGSGSGTEDDPYLILNPIQLNQIRNFQNKSGVYFKLMADIDLTEFLEDEDPMQGWQPISSFCGILDGNGKIISGLWVNRPDNDNNGLFASISNTTIKNLKIVDFSINGKDKIGALTGYAWNSQIINCDIKGIIAGNKNVGGCVGCANQIEISEVVCSAKIDAKEDVGGIIGKIIEEYREKNLISGCYLIDGELTGINNVGGICGGYDWISNAQGEMVMSNCHVKANISGVDYVGGVCGGWSGPISTSNYCGIIVGNSHVGGICGYGAHGGVNIEKCYALGVIIASGNNVGGICGYALQNINTCYFSGSVAGSEKVGGLVGNKNGYVITNSYSNASVNGTKYIGGLCGYAAEGTEIYSNVANAQSVKATDDYVGRIYGYGTLDRYGKSNITIGETGTNNENKAWNRTIIIKAGVAQEVSSDLQNGTGVSATTLKLKATYVAMGWDFTDTWAIQETECYPYFQTQTAPPVITSDVVSGATTISGNCVSGATVILDIDGVKQEKVFGGTSFSFTVDPLQAGHEVRVSAKADGKEQSYFTAVVVSYLGKGTEDDPYQISTAADLTCAYRKGYYKLMNDIDLTSYINQYSPTEGWESIGREGSETIYFDGDGHKITGLWCNSTRDNTGLFSCFANGYLKNLTVETANGKEVKGGSNTGILIGKMINGTIENCHVSGNVADGTPVGGIVGLLDGGKISLSKASVTINTTGDDTYVGGLVGDITNGEIDQCVTLGTITATGKNSQAGGLVGKNAATVTNCYCNVAVTSAYCAAGLVSYNYGLVEKSYATGNLSSQNYGAGVIGYNDGANAIIRNCVAMNQRIDVTFESQSAQSGGYGQRILGGYKNGAPDPELNNYALKTMQLSVNDVPQKVYNDIMNGTAKTGDDLMMASTYQTLGWDFTEYWSIAEGESYPSLKNNVAEVKTPEKIVLKVTPPTAITGLIYNGKEQSLVEAGSTTIGDMKYSLDGTTYSKSIPTGTDAKEYIVYYKVVDDTDLTEPESIKVTISAKTVSSPTITLSETSYVYDGNVKEPTVTVKDGETTIPASEYTVSYSNNTNVGTATVTITDKEGGNYIVKGSLNFTITASGESSIVNEEESVIVNGETLYELSEEVAEAIQETIETDIALPVEADSRVQVTGDGGLKFSKGSDLLMGLLDLKEKDIVTFVFTGRLFGNSSKLRQKNAASRGTRAAGDMELFSDVEYEVIEDGDQTVTVKLSESETTVEAITVTKPESSVSITINSSGKNTYTTAEALDFSGFDDLKAYVATGYEGSGTIWLTRVKQVPAGTPILIKGKAGKTYEVPVMDKCVAYFENMFQGSADNDVKIDVTSADGKWNNYYMAGGSFKKVTGPRTIDKGKCYLQLPASFKAAKAGEDQTVKISDSGKSSYAPPVDIDLTNVEGLKAYAATGYDAASQTIWLTRIFKIQAGEGVMLKGEGGKIFTLPASTEVQAYYGNMMIGNIYDPITINETSADGEWTNFYLASGSFKKVSGSREIGTNKSYLHLPASMLVSSARGKQNAGIDEWFMDELETETMLLGSIGGDDEDGTTRIDAITNDNAQPDIYYNLQGQRINSPKKGLYIHNGVKVVIK